MGTVVVAIREKLRVVELLIMTLVVILLLAASAPNVHAPGYSPVGRTGLISLGR